MTKHIIDRVFLLLAAASLVVGVSLGVGMGIAQDHSLAAVHVHLNLVGWASLALFGLTYRAYPAMAQSRLAKPHLLLSGSGGVLFPFGLYLLVAHGNGAFVGIPALMWLAGAVVFLVSVGIQTFSHPIPERRRLDLSRSPA